MFIFTYKPKLMAMSGKYSIPRKLLQKNRLIKSLNSFSYLGYNFSYDHDEI